MTTSTLFSRVHELNLDLLLEAQEALRDGRSQDAADLFSMGVDLQRIMDRLTALGHRQAQEMRDVTTFHNTQGGVTHMTPRQGKPATSDGPTPLDASCGFTAPPPRHEPCIVGIVSFEKLTTGNKYDVRDLTCVGWTDGDGTGHEGYDWMAYFLGGVYLGPDENGIEPLFQTTP